MKKDRIIWLTRGAVIAAMYVALTVTPPLNAISFGMVQFRLSEALGILAFFEPAAIPGLFVGCLLANSIGTLMGTSLGILDIVFGSLLTLLSAVFIWRIKQPLLALTAPVVLNAFGVAALLKIVLDLPYWPSVLFVGIGQTVVVYGLGYPLLLLMLKRRILIREDIFREKMNR
ncbi:MAG: QueT transporter family protein [Actinomycetota bacterium]|nr:QueT transporter family protein [Actinomycetota bacterium]